MERNNILMFIAVFAFVLCLVLSHRNCPKDPYCSCGSHKILKILCKNVTNLHDILPVLNAVQHVDRLQVSGSFRSLPKGIFNGRSIASLALIGPLAEVAEEAFDGVESLQLIKIYFSRYDQIPKAVNIKSITFLYLSYGKLLQVGEELQNMTATMILHLNNNAITNISTGAFEGNSYLQILNLANNHLTILNSEVFAPLKELRILDLSHNLLLSIDGFFDSFLPQIINLYGNNLTNIDKAFKPGMWTVKELNLGANVNLNLSGAIFNRTMSSLSILRLENNLFRTIDPDLLKYLDLHGLYLSGNCLVSIPKEFFTYSNLLHGVRLSDNLLTTIDDTFPATNTLREVSVDGNNISSFKSGAALQDVIRLDLSRNSMREITVEDFKPLTHMQELNMSGNPLELIESDSFKKMYKIDIIDLSRSNIQSLNKSIQHINLNTLLVQSSDLRYVDEDEFVAVRYLKKVFLRNNSLTTLYGAFRNVPQIFTLDVSSNNLTTLTADSFPTYRGSPVRVKILWMADNPWSCDCRLSWIPHWLTKHGKLMDNPICQSPAHLKGITIRSLNQTDLDWWVEDCPDTCDCLCVADGENVYSLVNCSNKSLSKPPAVFPANVQEIDFTNNRILYFSGLEKDKYEVLLTLNFENNQLTEVKLDLPSSVKELLLAENNLREFPFADWDKSSLNTTTLSGNPWNCDCDYGWKFKQWLSAHNESVLDLEEVRCGMQESIFIKNKVIINLDHDDFCSRMTLELIVIITGSAISILLFLLLCICLRKWIGALFYSWGCLCLKKKNKSLFSYDVFLLYSEENEEVAVGEIAHGLETQHMFHVCIPNRDIPEPRSMERISAFIVQCHMIIVILTSEFLENSENLRLLGSSISYSIEDTSRKIILVTFEDLPPLSGRLDPRILKTSDRLRWNSFLFWPRLLYRLPRKMSEEEEIDPAAERLLGGIN